MMNGLDSGISLQLKTDDLVISILPKSPPNHNTYKIAIKAPSIDLNFYGEVDPTLTDGYIISTPLSTEKTHYFVTNKKLAMPVEEGSISYKGEQIDCGNECLIVMDSFRSHLNYGADFVWTHL